MWRSVGIKNKQLQWLHIGLFILTMGLAACEGGGNNRGDQEPEMHRNPNDAITSPNTGTTEADSNYQGNMEENRIGEGVFNSLDTNKDGYLTQTEWEGVEELNTQESRTFEQLDRNKDGRIDQTEFNEPRD